MLIFLKEGKKAELEAKTVSYHRDPQETRQ
jgi:hypothetical protein